jgi:hypothetical protein
VDSIKDDLLRVLKSLEEMTEPLDELVVSRQVRSVGEKLEMKENPIEFIAEIFAFDLHEAREISKWDLYYGPMLEGTNQDGSAFEHPSLSMITSDMVQYWMNRSRISKHPVLTARYADLVWEFTKVVTGKQPDIEFAQLTIDNVIHLAHNGSYSRDIGVIKKLERALSLALQTNDSNRVEQLKSTIMSFEDRVAEDDKPGLWGFSFDLLIDKKKINLTEAEQHKIISDLETRLSNVTRDSESDSFNPWAAEAAVERLATYYRKHNKSAEMKKAVLAFGDAFITISNKSSPIQASSWLQRVHSVYGDYSLRDEANAIVKKIRELGPRMNSEMKQISHSMEIPTEKMNAYVNGMIDGTLTEVLERIIIQYIPQQKQVREQLYELSKRAPVSFLFSRQIHDHQGRHIATIGSLESDESGHIIGQMSQNMQITAVFLREVMTKLIEKFKLTEDKLVNYLYKSPAFDTLKTEIIQQGIKSYINNDHLVAVHLLIPQIEDTLRRILEAIGGTVLKKSRGGSGFHFKTLDELLRDEQLVAVFGEDVMLYFRVVLTDQRGWNLRNDVCHGITPQSAFGAAMADRIVHILLCLAPVRYSEKE